MQDVLWGLASAEETVTCLHTYPCSHEMSYHDRNLDLLAPFNHSLSKLRRPNTRAVPFRKRNLDIVVEVPEHYCTPTRIDINVRPK